MLDMDGDNEGNADVGIDGISDVFESVSLIVGVGSEDSEKFVAEGCVVLDGDIDIDGDSNGASEIVGVGTEDSEKLLGEGCVVVDGDIDIDGVSESFTSLVVTFSINEGAKEGPSDTEDLCLGSRDRCGSMLGIVRKNKSMLASRGLSCRFLLLFKLILLRIEPYSLG